MKISHLITKLRKISLSLSNASACCQKIYGFKTLKQEKLYQNPRECLTKETTANLRHSRPSEIFYAQIVINIHQCQIIFSGFFFFFFF